MYHDLSSGDDGKVGNAKVRNSSVLVPAGETMEVKCSARIKVPNTRDSVLAQEPTETSLPEGLKVVGCRVATHSLPDVKLVVVNESDGDILLCKNQVIADVFVYQHEYDVHRILGDLSPQQTDSEATVLLGNAQCEGGFDGNTVDFKFGEDCSPEWCTQFKSRLQSYTDVFIQGEFDIGRAKVDDAFDITLEPGPDIRERARPIPPKDFEECKQHIQGLLDTSAYAAELHVGDRVLVRKLGIRVESKISDKWEKDVYVVLSKVEVLPVYTVQIEKGSGPKRTLHRKYLLPIGMLDSEIRIGREPPSAVSNSQDRSKQGQGTQRGETVPQSDSEEQEIIVEISPPEGFSSLRPEAPPFVPNDPLPMSDVDDQCNQESSEREEEHSSSSEPSVVSDHDEVNVTGEDDSHVPQGSSSEEDEVEDSRVGPRQSTRRKKPVDRLNFVHRARLEGCDFSDWAQLGERVAMLNKHFKKMPVEYVLFDIANILGTLTSKVTGVHLCT
ncbi:hypothetical protein BaRGS_00005265 [Batillaria attramentaria]|uniref:Uncharacterized protein n=1 Tax=Batillaria attramentaria TaxID=370345 RepID=A0ABD0LUR5_9CAEN